MAARPVVLHCCRSASCAGGGWPTVLDVGGVSGDFESVHLSIDQNECKYFTTEKYATVHEVKCLV